MEWSTVVDAPVTYGMTLEELKQRTKQEYGRQGLKELDDRLKRLDEKGHSVFDNRTLGQLIKYNRAGDNEKRLPTLKAIYQKYCIEK